MTAYGTALFIHIIAAIVLVGGSAWAHFTLHLAKRADTVDGARAHTDNLAGFVRVSGPIALVTVVAGLYLTWAGDWWGAGWPSVSLGLFVIAGALAFSVEDPAVRAAVADLSELPSGPASSTATAALSSPRLTVGSWVMTGADLAIVVLMTNKPGLGVSLVVGAVGLLVGGAIGLREARHATAPQAAAPAV